jgi:hypothetical protein
MQTQAKPESIVGRLERAQRLALAWADRNEDANILGGELGSIIEDLSRQDRASESMSEIAGLTTATLIEVRCGCCGAGEPFAPDGIGYACATSEELAIKIVGDAGGVILNDTVYCSDCVDDRDLAGPINPLDAPALAHDENTARVFPPS